jgi:hypothetical protein
MSAQGASFIDFTPGLQYNKLKKIFEKSEIREFLSDRVIKAEKDEEDRYEDIYFFHSPAAGGTAGGGYL